MCGISLCFQCSPFCEATTCIADSIYCTLYKTEPWYSLLQSSRIIKMYTYGFLCLLAVLRCAKSGLVCQARLLSECFEHLGVSLCVPLPGKAASSFECISTYWNESVILAVYNNSEYSPWLFKYVTCVPVNYSELEANSKKCGSLDVSHLSVANSLNFCLRAIKNFSLYF